MKIPTLKTERLILRPLTLDDVPAIQDYFNDWEMIKFTTAPWPYPLDSARENILSVLSNIEQGKQVDWAITLPTEPRYNGFIGRVDYRFKEHYTDRGFWLARPFQNQGFMTEAIIATQDYMFFERKLETLRVRNNLSNIASRRIKEKTGGVRIGEEEAEFSHLNEPLEVWEVTRENWAKIRGRKL